jgi:hypothetical protein
MKRHLTAALVACCLQLPAGMAVTAGEQPAGASEAAPASAPAEAQTRSGENCIPLHRIQHTRVLDDRTILFELSGNETLVNRLPYRCPGLGFEKSFGYKTSITQLCSQDIIWVILNGAGGGIDRGASCGLGKFEPWVAPAKSGADEPVSDDGKSEPR